MLAARQLAGLLMLGALLLGACRSIAAYRQASADGARDQASDWHLPTGDDGRTDSSSDGPGDGPPPPLDSRTDARSDGPGDGPPLDICTPPLDLGAGDGLVISPPAACLDTESQDSAACLCAPLGDPDCDGLQGTQDPWPFQHNLLRVGDGFATDPFNSADRRWTIALPTTCKWSQAVQWNSNAQTATANGCASLTLDQNTCGAALKDTDYLVEVRFTVDALRNPLKDEWAFSISFGAGPLNSRECRFFEWQSAPHVRIAAGTGSAQTQPTGLTLAAVAQQKQTYLLQAYSFTKAKTTENHCRLLTAFGQTLLGKDAAVEGSTSSVLPIKVAVIGVDVTIDHVRIYEAYPQLP